MKAYEYKLVDGSKESVESQVNDLAQGGWQIVGCAQVRTFNGGVSYTQTLVRETEQRGPWN